MQLVLQYQSSDGFHYWNDEVIIFKSESIEEAYVSICSKIESIISQQKDFYKSHKDEDLYGMYIKIQDVDISFNNFVNLQDEKVEVNLITLEEYINELKYNSKNLTFN
jgi:hypothetical protein